MKTNLFSRLSALCVILFLSTTTLFAINWADYSWVGNGSGNAAYTDKYKIAPAEGMNVVNLQYPGFASKAGFYITFRAGILSCSHTCDIQGAGIVLHVDQFTAQETEVNVVDALGTYNFTVYYADGTAGGATEADTIAPVMVSATLVGTAAYNQAVIAVQATDNVGVTKYVVTDAANSIDAEYAAVDNQITVTNLTAETSYNLVVKAKDAAQNVSAEAQTITFTTPAHLSAPLTAAPVPPTYGAGKAIVVFSDVNTKPVNWGYCENWSQSTSLETVQIAGDNTLKYSNFNYLGMAAAADINALTMDTLHIDIWSENAFSPRIFPICHTQLSGEQSYTLNVLAGQWNSFDIPVSYFTEKQLDMSGVYQFKLDNGSNNTFYIDNLYFYKHSDGADTEAPTGLTATLASTSFYSAVITCSATDNSGSVLFNVYNGTQVVGTGSAVSGANATVNVKDLTPGTAYTFVVKAVDADGNECAETVSILATTQSLPSAAPTPTQASGDVISLYSDTYTAAASYIVGGWGQSTVSQEVALATGNNAWLLTNFNYLGWEINGNVAAFDATEMQNLHIDIFATDVTSFQLTPIWGGESLYTCTPLTANAWNSFDIPLTSFTGINKANIYQIKFVAEPTNKAIVFVDNVYFWKATGSNTNVVTNDMMPNISLQGNMLHIEQAQVALVAVYTLTGACVYQTVAASAQVELESGLYLIKAGNTTTKLMVR